MLSCCGKDIKILLVFLCLAHLLIYLHNLMYVMSFILFVCLNPFYEICAPYRLVLLEGQARVRAP